MVMMMKKRVQYWERVIVCGNDSGMACDGMGWDRLRSGILDSTSWNGGSLFTQEK